MTEEIKQAKGIQEEAAREPESAEAQNDGAPPAQGDITPDGDSSFFQDPPAEEPEGVKEKKKEPPNFKRELFGWLEAIVGAVVVVALVITFVGRPILVEGESMLPNFHGNDRVITTSIYRELKRGDVVVIKRKDAPLLIKRVVALAGDTVDFNWDAHEFLLNGQPVNEPFINEPMVRPVYNTIPFPATVPPGHVFVMGDNRNNSDDSRDPSIGMIDLQNISGKVVFQIWPLNKFGPIRFAYER